MVYYLRSHLRGGITGGAVSQDFFVTVRLEKPVSADMVSCLLFARKTSVKGCERSEKSVHRVSSQL